MTNNPEKTYPLAVLWSWENRFKALRDVETVNQMLDDKDTEIDHLVAALERAKAAVEKARSEHRGLGKQRTEYEKSAEAFLEMVETWCKNHGQDMPPEPAAPPEPAPADQRPDSDPMHNAGIWEAAECEGCGARILRNKLTSGPWGHPGNGSSRCRPEDEDSPVATPKAKPPAEPAPEQTTSDAEAAPAREEATTDA